MKTNIIFTIGHGNHTAKHIISICIKNGITLLADCRSKPYSKWNPMCNRSEFETQSANLSFNYQWKPELGGLNLDEYYLHKQGIKKLIESNENETICIMCSESDYRQCHRFSSLTKEIIDLNFLVCHINNSTGEKIKEQTSFLV